MRKVVPMKPPRQSMGAAEEVERHSMHAGIEECIQAKIIKKMGLDASVLKM